MLSDKVKSVDLENLNSLEFFGVELSVSILSKLFLPESIKRLEFRLRCKDNIGVWNISKCKNLEYVVMR